MLTARNPKYTVKALMRKANLVATLVSIMAIVSGTFLTVTLSSAFQPPVCF